MFFFCRVSDVIVPRPGLCVDTMETGSHRVVETIVQSMGFDGF